MNASNQFGLFAEEIDGEIVVLDQARNQVHHFNETASYVWKALQAGDSLESIAESICAVYDVEPDAARVDIEEIIAEFSRLKLRPGN